MNAEANRKLLSVRPFDPVEIELSSGQIFTIKHPENVIVLKNTLVVTEPETDTVQWTSLIHIVAVRKRQSSQPNQVPVCDQDGNVLGFFLPYNLYKKLLYENVQVPFSEEELERFRQSGEGCSLAEFWRKMGVQ